MIWNVFELVSYLSEGTTLKAGTVIFTGTPEGVGFVRNPPVYLKQGDVVKISIDGMGYQESHVLTE